VKRRTSSSDVRQPRTRTSSQGSITYMRPRRAGSDGPASRSPLIALRPSTASTTPMRSGLWFAMRTA
jgi:hypothetical protein